MNVNKKTEEELKEIILTSEAYVALGLKSNEADGKSISAAIMELQARVEKAEKELGFHYKYSLIDGLQKLIDWRIETGLDKIK